MMNEVVSISQAENICNKWIGYDECSEEDKSLIKKLDNTYKRVYESWEIEECVDVFLVDALNGLGSESINVWYSSYGLVMMICVRYPEMLKEYKLKILKKAVQTCYLKYYTIVDHQLACLLKIIVSTVQNNKRTMKDEKASNESDVSSKEVMDIIEMFLNMIAKDNVNLCEVISNLLEYVIVHNLSVCPNEMHSLIVKHSNSVKYLNRIVVKSIMNKLGEHVKDIDVLLFEKRMMNEDEVIPIKDYTGLDIMRDSRELTIIDRRSDRIHLFTNKGISQVIVDRGNIILYVRSTTFLTDLEEIRNNNYTKESIEDFAQKDEYANRFLASMINQFEEYSNQFIDELIYLKIAPISIDDQPIIVSRNQSKIFSISGIRSCYFHLIPLPDEFYSDDPDPHNTKPTFFFSKISRTIKDMITSTNITNIVFTLNITNVVPLEIAIYTIFSSIRDTNISNLVCHVPTQNMLRKINSMLSKKFSVFNAISDGLVAMLIRICRILPSIATESYAIKSIIYMYVNYFNMLSKDAESTSKISIPDDKEGISISTVNNYSSLLHKSLTRSLGLLIEHLASIVANYDISRDGYITYSKIIGKSTINRDIKKELFQISFIRNDSTHLSGRIPGFAECFDITYHSLGVIHYLVLSINNKPINVK